VGTKPEELVTGPAFLYPVKAAATRARSMGWLLRRRPPLPPDGKLRILFYHRVSDDGDELAVPPQRFREQMQILARLGVRATDILSALSAQSEAEQAVGLSFDDAYADVADNAVPVLRELGFAATVFVPTAVIDGRAALPAQQRPAAFMTWERLRELDREGVLRAEAHSVTHRNLLALDDAEARNEIVDSRAELAEQLEREVTAFAYPAGLAGPREIRLAREAGYELAVTCEPGLNDATTDPHALRRTQIDARDGLLDFRAKLGGGHDSPLPLRRIYRRRRFGMSSPD
jgi:peptidoglycan/xylan/chitin deacetylase (PgdA/CDA1 family)